VSIYTGRGCEDQTLWGMSRRSKSQAPPNAADTILEQHAAPFLRVPVIGSQPPGGIRPSEGLSE